MNLEEVDDVEADEKSPEVDSKDEVMHVRKSDMCMIFRVERVDGRASDEERVLQLAA